MCNPVSVTNTSVFFLPPSIVPAAPLWVVQPHLPRGEPRVQSTFQYRRGRSQSEYRQHAGKNRNGLSSQNEPVTKGVVEFWKDTQIGFLAKNR